MQPLPNTIKIRFLSSHSRCAIVAWALLLLVIWLTQVSLVAGQDLKSMPWTDQDSGEVTPLGVEKRAQSLTRDRSSIPIKKVKAKAPAAPPVFAPPAGAGAAMLGPVLVYGLVLIGALLLIGLVVWVFMNSKVDIDSAPVSSRSDRSIAESIRHLPFEMDVKKGDFRQQSQAAYDAGDFRMALVFLFSHVLVTLDQAKLVRLKKGKTNRQYLRELSPNRPLGDYYGDVMVPFEQTFFGDYPITKEVFEGCWHGLDGFQSEVDIARSKVSRSNSVQGKAVLENAVVDLDAAASSTAEGTGTHA